LVAQNAPQINTQVSVVVHAQIKESPKVVVKAPAPPVQPSSNSASNSNPPPSPPKQAELSIITAPPFAEVFFDGKFLGNTPLKNQTVPTGRHRLQVSHRRFKAIDTVLNLRSQELTLRFRLFGE
jgi:hypothetical protein